MKGRSVSKELIRLRKHTRTHIHTYTRNIQSHDAYTYMHIRSAGYSVKNGTTGVVPGDGTKKDDLE